MLLPAALVFASLLPAQPAAAPKFEISDGDRIVWIGNTLVEREQRYGYWETALHAAFPDKQFTLRNLGWSGDTVFGDARAGFENAAKGFERLVSLTLELKPTVIFVSYGTNESFEGEAGLEKFEKGLEKLLDALKPTKARVVLFSPLPMEKAGTPHPQDKMLKKYGDAIRKVATARKLAFADLHHYVGQHLFSITPNFTVMDNGMHLTEAGFAFEARQFLGSLGLDVERAPKTEDAEKIRQAIVEKNQLFFYKWRPQNETYLFGFRKHEQGKNAKEVVEFDPLIAKAEDEIEKLRKALK